MTILERIVDNTRQGLSRRKRRIPRLNLEEIIQELPETRDFASALRGDALSFIAELKKASPSRGVLRDEFDVEVLASSFENGGASAISVLTEEDFFQGNLTYLRRVRKQVQVPLLRKDFIVDPYQLYEARAYGADAVLLIARTLDAAELQDLILEAEKLGLACLVELYTERELDKLDFGLVRILGVNNRDLETFEVNIGNSLRVFRHCPEQVIRVSESGLQNAGELAILSQHGVDAVLIGESFMQAHDPGGALAQMRTDLQEELVLL